MPFEAEAQDVVINKLQIIFKTVERCNLACPYCYYFYGADQSYKDRPARTTLETVDHLCDFLVQGVESANIKTIDVVFHGGEPMLQKIADFEETCQRLTTRVGLICKLNLVMQTNGTKLNDAWAETFQKYNIGLGISIDGTPSLHDANRPYHSGRGSFDEIRRRMQNLRSSYPEYYNTRTGSLTVLNAKADYHEIVEFFATELGIKRQNFLLPDCTHEDGIPDGCTAEDYGRALCTIFDKCTEIPGVSVREVNKILRRFQKAILTKEGHDREETYKRNKVRVIDNQVIVVQSDGELKVDDSYIPAEQWRKDAPVVNVKDVSLKDYVQHRFFSELYEQMATPPSKCEGCMWVKICGGGDLENRWSAENGFNNPSVFCESLKMFYEHTVRYLLSNGYPMEDIYTRLSGEYFLDEFGYAS